MTTTFTHPSGLAAQPARPTRVLMCRPSHFEVSYVINPWMDPTIAVSTERAVQQWESLRQAYLDLGFEVELIDPVPGLPDMVYAANGAFVVDGIAYEAKFRYPQRQPEGEAYLARLEELGMDCRRAQHTNEGEGDFLIVGDQILAGHGFRTSTEAHAEASAIFDREVLSLRLVDPRFYHLDTAMAVVGNSFAWLPSAFDEAAQDLLRRRWPDAIEVDVDEAAVLGLNTFGDGANIVMTDRAPRLAAALSSHGHHVVTVDLSELLKGGGSVKCCTLELRS